MSDIEVLKLVIDHLDHIQVPVQYTQQIAIPIDNASNILKQLYDAVIKAAEEKQEAEKKEPVVEEPVAEE